MLRLFEHADTHGAFPLSLEDLEGTSEIDPFTGEPFIYRLTDDGFTLYSAGLDRDDDGGKHDGRFGEKRGGVYGKAPAPDGDYVFWPLPD